MPVHITEVKRGPGWRVEFVPPGGGKLDHIRVEMRLVPEAVGVGEALAGQPGAVGAIGRAIVKEVDKEARRRARHRTEAVEWDETFTVRVRGDEGGLRKLLEYIQRTAGIGHSFEVVVDPDDSEYRRRFGIDGDGPFRMEVG